MTCFSMEIFLRNHELIKFTKKHTAFPLKGPTWRAYSFIYHHISGRCCALLFFGVAVTINNF